jgi:hypothetical protein
MNIQQAKEKIRQAFNADKPIVAKSDVIGCCDEHENDFQWYKDNDVEEFRKQISRDFFDWPQFGSLRSDLFCYFTKGFLLETLDTLKDTNQSLDSASWIEDFLILYTPEKKDIKSYVLDKVSVFSQDQINAIREVIKIIDLHHFELRGYHDKLTLIAIEKVWVAQSGSRGVLPPSPHTTRASGSALGGSQSRPGRSRDIE